MKTKAVPSSWIERLGKRLDCGPYMSGIIEARERLEALGPRTRPLCELTKGGIAGMYHVGMDKLKWVDDTEHGTRFLTSSDIVKADFSGQPFISSKQVAGNPLFQCPVGSTLITRSGTIGRMAYCRAEMAEMAISQDVLKIVPDKNRIPSGYLFAFLSTKYGLPLVVGETFGSIIVHIEAKNIANLPVPRLGDSLERTVHALVEGAAANRSDAARLRAISGTRLAQHFRLPDLSRAGTPKTFGTFAVRAQSLARLDAAYYCKPCVVAVDAFASCNETSPLGTVAQVFQTNIFKRPYVDDSRYGYPYFSGIELFTYAPEPRAYLRKNAEGIESYVVHCDWLLMQDAGQLGGLIGRVMRVGKDLDGSVVSNHLVRIVASSRTDSAFLFTVLNSPCGYRAVIRNAFGTSIPQLESRHLESILIPWPATPLIREQIADPILRAWDLEDEAIELDRKAVALVEHAIEEAA